MLAMEGHVGGAPVAWLLFIPPAAQPQRASPDIAFGVEDLALEAVVVLANELVELGLQPAPGRRLAGGQRAGGRRVGGAQRGVQVCSAEPAAGIECRRKRRVAEVAQQPGDQRRLDSWALVAHRAAGLRAN